MPLRTFSFAFVLSCCLFGCTQHTLAPNRVLLSESNGSVTIEGDVWADNWFALYLGEELLIEDSVSIQTERSFNAESFTFKADYPIVLNLIAKDFKEDDSGLEYIGTRKQQLGDGGLIAQFRDATTGQLIAGTNTEWQCYVLHHGPVDEACEKESNPQAGVGPCAFNVQEEPEGWKSADFASGDWNSARIFSVAEVRPKGGYDQISWDEAAKLIWSDDLKKDNTVLFRLVIESPRN